jgi:hypothetical protein
MLLDEFFYVSNVEERIILKTLSRKYISVDCNVEADPDMMITVMKREFVFPVKQLDALKLQKTSVPMHQICIC